MEMEMEPQVYYPRHVVGAKKSRENSKEIMKELEEKNKKIANFNRKISLLALFLVGIILVSTCCAIKSKKENENILLKVAMLDAAVSEANSTILKAREEASLEVKAAELLATSMLDAAEEEASEIVESADGKE